MNHHYLSREENTDKPGAHSNFPLSSADIDCLMSKYEVKADEERMFERIKQLWGGSRYAGVIFTAVLLGAQVFMVTYSISVFLNTPKEKRTGCLRLVIVSCFILIISLIGQSSEFWVIYPDLIDHPTRRRWLEVHGEKGTPGAVADASHFLTIAVGDLLTLWRCLVLWSHKKWVLVLPLLTCTGSIVFSIVSVSLGVKALQPINITGNDTRMVLASLSVATNIMVTSLILLRLLTARWAMSKVFPDRKPPGMYSRVVAMVIESAAPLAVCGLCYVVFVYEATRSEWGSSTVDALGYAKAHILERMFWWAYVSVAALSPQMIIFRVTVGRSWRNATESKAAFSRPIQFTQAAKETGTMSIREP
ncbi:hypothetical protein BKA70DRAFT_1535760 [Coprinopsis sp. MPI-PUGE-AT-0042]|nr:hypothetical protein BKA70DRAFT_1535760 [Coprinopsis sp. MPI-PUGE-AT-0042]